MDEEVSFSVNIKLLNWIGLWSRQKNVILRRFYPLLTFANLGIFTSFFTCQIIYLITNWGNVEEMVAVLYHMVTVIGEYFKMYPLLFTARKVKNLVRDVQQPSFLPKNRTHEDTLSKGRKITRANSLFFMGSCITVASFWGLYPVLDGSYKEYNLPMVVWIPVDLTIGNTYIYAYAISYYGIIWSALISSAYDTLFAGLMIHAGVQLDNLSESIANIKVDANKNTQLEGEFIEKITKCIDHYMDIIRFTVDVENIFSKGAMAEFFAAGFVLIVTLFQLTMTPLVSFQFAALATYLSCIMYALFIYCWFANEIILKSEKVIEAAYSSDWHVCGHKKYRRILLLLMVCLQRPIMIRAGHLIPLSVETFMTIVKSSWSYFNLLRQVNDDETAE